MIHWPVMARLKRRRSLLVVVALFAHEPSQAEQSDDSAFFQQRSQHAYNSVFGLPVTAPRLVQSLEWQFAVEHSNQFAGGEAGDEKLILDGETTRLAIRHRQRLGACWQFEATIPFVSHHEGQFDRAIDDWHKFFGLPDANRDNTDFDRFVYQYSDAEGIKHDLTKPQSGIADVLIAVQHAFECQATADSTGAESMIRAGIKLPTGNPSELRGSGGVDVFADWQSPVWSDHKRWRWGAAAGVLLPARSSLFADQEALVLYGSVGVQFVLHQKLRLITQLDGHSPFYRSALSELGDSAFNIALGARYLAAQAYTFELSISEDAAIDTTPDIVARLAMTYRPQPGL